jgi:tetratricopeptide (TPR) repeat protein
LSTFQEFLDAARRDHTEHTDAVAAQLEGGLPHVATADDVPPYASFVVHVFGEHLGEWERGAKLLDAIGALPVARGDARVQLSVRRGIAALRYAAGDASAIEGLASADTAQVMCVICTTHVARHETEPAIAALKRALDIARSQPLPGGHAAIRSLAVAGNNLSVELEEKAHLTDGERSAMVLAAETGLEFWKLAGTWMEEERAESQLARCLLRAGEIDGAREHVARAIAICAREPAPAWDRFFSRSVHTAIERAAGNDEGWLEARQAALAAYEALPEGERKWCQRELADLGEEG